MRIRPRCLERGAASLEYLEGIRLAKSLDLCSNCFRRLFEAANERDLLATGAGVQPEAVADTPGAGRPA